MIPEMRHLLFVYVAHNFLKYNGLSHLRVLAQYESYTHKEPLYLVSNMESAEEACRYYEKRFRIETFFSDQKSRGFNIQKSRLEDPQRLSRLLMATCLAYIWVVYLGSLCEKSRWNIIIPRRKRRDLSLFQLGLRLLEHFFNEGLPIPVQFHVTI
jgi:Transposase DDE domain